MYDSNPVETKKSLTGWIIFACVVVVGLWIVVVLWGSSNADIPFISLPKNIEHRGQFGDMLNIVTSLVTSLAFVFIVFGFIAQREEIKIAKEEAKDTKKQLRRQIELNEKQEKLIKEQSENIRKQTIDDSALKLIGLFSETRKNLADNDFSATVKNFHDKFWEYLWGVCISDLRNNKGHTQIKELYKEYFYSDHPNSAKEIPEIKNSYEGIKNAPNSIETIIGLIPDSQFIEAMNFFAQYTNENKRDNCLQFIFSQMTPEMKLQTMQRAFDAFFIDNGHITGSYFRLLFNIVEAIDNFPNSKYYMNLLRALFSKHEIELFFYNLLSENGSSEFVEFVEQHDLLKGIECEEIVPFDTFNKELIKDLLSIRKKQPDSDYSIHSRS